MFHLAFQVGEVAAECRIKRSEWRGEKNHIGRKKEMVSERITDPCGSL